MVRDFEGQPRTTRDPYRLLDRLEQLLGLIPHVRHVNAAVFRRYRRQRYDLLSLGEGPRRANQAGRQPQRAGGHPLGDRVSHQAQLCVVGFPALHPQREVAHRAVRDEAPHVNREFGAIDSVHVFAEALPVAFLPRAENDVYAGHRRPRGVPRRHPGTAVAHDVRRHALQQLEVHACAHDRVVVVRRR